MPGTCTRRRDRPPPWRDPTRKISQIQPVRGATPGSAATVPYASTDPGAVEVDDPGVPLYPERYPQGSPEEPLPDTGDAVLWLKMPAELAAYFDIGFCHTDTVCPYVVLCAKDDTAQGHVEVSGPPEAFIGLADVIVTLCRSVPCLSHGARGEAAPSDLVASAAG